MSSVQVQESELESTDLEISSTPPTDVSRDKTPALSDWDRREDVEQAESGLG